MPLSTIRTFRTRGRNQQILIVEAHTCKLSKPLTVFAYIRLGREVSGVKDAFCGKGLMISFM
jgi:hypothetical protein